MAQDLITVNLHQTFFNAFVVYISALDQINNPMYDAAAPMPVNGSVTPGAVGGDTLQKGGKKYNKKLDQMGATPNGTVAVANDYEIAVPKWKRTPMERNPNNNNGKWCKRRVCGGLAGSMPVFAWRHSLRHIS